MEYQEGGVTCPQCGGKNVHQEAAEFFLTSKKMEGAHRCVMHSGRAAELGRKGGRRRAVYSPDGLKEFSPPRTAAELRDLLAQSIIEIRTGQLDPKLANSISYLGTGFFCRLEG